MRYKCGLAAAGWMGVLASVLGAAGSATQPAASQPAAPAAASSRPAATQLDFLPRPVEHRAFTVAGIDFTEGEFRSYLIPQAWIALAPQLHRIPHQVEPLTLYGVWHRKPGALHSSYLVGVQVIEVRDLPEGITAVDVPAGRYAMMEHIGNLAYASRTYGSIQRWMTDNKVEAREGPAFEVYDTSQPIDDRYHVPIYKPIR